MKYSTLNSKQISVPRFNEESGFYATSRSSKTMKKIKSNNSKAEVLLRKKLWEYGYRYRISNYCIKGKPDIVFTKRKLAIFIDGDFWHGYNWSNKKMKLKSNVNYWIPKIERNIQRDLEVNAFLKLQGWKVIRFWEHDVLDGVDLCVVKIMRVLEIESD